MKRLSKLVLQAKAARSNYEERCLEVWKELQVVDPELVEIVRTLGPGEKAAARWVCAPMFGGETPAEKVAAGRVDDLLRRMNAVLRAPYA